MSHKDLALQEKKELETRSENTRNVPLYIPPVDIYESRENLTLLADMPGVSIENVEIDLNGDQLTIRGTADTVHSGGETPLLCEYSPGDYYRQFTISNKIDRGKIEASMKDGVLKVVLPKAEVAKPRRIEVKVAA